MISPKNEGVKKKKVVRIFTIYHSQEEKTRKSGKEGRGKSSIKKLYVYKNRVESRRKKRLKKIIKREKEKGEKG